MISPLDAALHPSNGIILPTDVCYPFANLQVTLSAACIRKMNRNSYIDSKNLLETMRGK